jgi:arabinogalactan oligomer/maltooligosaccharide transport system permease protein
MSTLTQSEKGGASAPPASQSISVTGWIVRLGALAVIDAIALWLLYNMFNDGVWYLGIVLAVVTIILNAVFLREDLYPLRWVSPGLALLVVMVVYPIFFTVYTAFTNYGDGHLLTKQQVIRQLERQRYLPEGEGKYDYIAYISPDATPESASFILWLNASDGSETLIARPGQPVEIVEPGQQPPETIDGYQQLTSIQFFRYTVQLAATQFGSDDRIFQVDRTVAGKAGRYQQRYIYLPEEDVIVDLQTDVVYTPVEGTFTAADGTRLRPGFQVYIGPDNFVRLLTSPSLRGPFIMVFLWTIAFAVLSVLTTFAVGLFFALAFNTRDLPLQKLLRSLLLIPYAIPAFISVPVWVGLLNPQFGVFSDFLSVFGITIPWFSDPTWAKVGILSINLWLGFPYMFLITTGALQALPSDIYEAANIDGASAWQTFRAITLPLLLITVGPLLVASFAYNFNNFVLIDLYAQGGPPMSGTLSPVGHTDVLVTYTYRIAFASGRGADLGYAAAITVAIFLILVVITYFQFKYTNMLEEVSENV